MRVSVSVLLVISFAKSQIKTAALVELLGPYIDSRTRLSILWSLIRWPEHVYEHGRESSRRISDS